MNICRIMLVFTLFYAFVGLYVSRVWLAKVQLAAETGTR